MTNSAEPWARQVLVADVDWQTATIQACRNLDLPPNQPPDLLLLFVSGHYAPHYADLLAIIRQQTSARVVVGCAASGFLAGDTEVEHGPGLSLLALGLPGAVVQTVRLDDCSESEVLDVNSDINAWLMLADPLRIDTLGLIQRLKQASPGRPIVGGMSSALDREHGGTVFLNDQVFFDGAIAVGLGGSYTMSASVAQGCFPVGEPWTITDVQRNALLGISNLPAVDVLQKTLSQLTPRQRELAPGNVMVGLAVDEYLDHYGQGDFFVRGILGVDHKRGAVVIGGLPRVGQTMQFHMRDAALAHLELRQAVEQAVTQPGRPIGAVLCTCEGRGSRLFGEPHHDARQVTDLIPGVPLAGAFCATEIGPLGKTTVLHGFSATLAVIRQLTESPSR